MSIDGWNPKQYDKFKNERAQPFLDLMALLQPQNEAQIIDLGCGTGELTSKLHRQLKAKSTLGIDSSGEMLTKASAHQTPGLTFNLGNIDAWSATNSFDIVFSNAALQWCSNHAHLFSKIKEALRPGGQLAVQMPMNHDYPTHVIAQNMTHPEPWASLLGTEKYEKKKDNVDRRRVRQDAFFPGISGTESISRVYDHVLDSREGVIEWVKGTLLTHFKSRLSEADYQRFLVEFRERLFLQLSDEKPFFYPFKRTLMWART